MRRIRIPLFLFSLILLGFSFWAFNRRVTTGLSILDPEFFKHRQSPEERDAETAAYVTRIRTDAYDRIARGDYENALVRLDQAARYDQRTDWTSPEVQRAREVIERHLGPSDTPPSASGATTTPPAPSTAPSTSTSPGRTP